MKTEGDSLVEKTLNMSITEASEEKEQQKTAEGRQIINSFPSHFYFKPNTALTLRVCLPSVHFNHVVELKFNLWLHYVRQN